MAKSGMNSVERRELIKIIDGREANSHAELNAHVAKLQAEVEAAIHEQFTAREALAQTYEDRISAIMRAAVEEARVVIDEAKANPEVNVTGTRYDAGATVSWTLNANFEAEGKDAAIRQARLDIQAKRGAALTSISKTFLDKKEEVLLAGVESDEAREIIKSLPQVDSVLPASAILGVVDTVALNP